MELADHLSDELREQLDAVLLKVIIEYTIERLGAGTGEQHIRYQATNGRLRGSQIERRRISNAELEHVGRG